MNKLKLYLIYGGGNPQWNILQHNGPMFPPPYIPHKIPIIINNKEIILPELAEEYATMYAKYIDTDYVKNNIFNKNFWKEFKAVIPSEYQSLTLNDFDFSLIKNYLIQEREIKINMSKEEKERIKIKQNELEKPYKYCIIDGSQQQVGNYKIEPPGIFLGRGTHPESGKIKKRVMPEDVIINISKNYKIPEPNIKGHKWGKIINDTSVVWLASWKEKITGKTKYVFTSLDSFFKSKSDEEKFDIARQLKKKVNNIRITYEKLLSDSNTKNRQLSTALYFIDHLSLRVGGNKDTKKEADTVGVTSLRVEHITLLDDNIIKLDFLGKDSVRFCKKVHVLEQVYKNIIDFSKDKNKKDALFDEITASVLNEYLNNYLEGLTAKVWRTFNASFLFQKELDKIKEEHLEKFNSNEKINYLIAMFNQANTEVALLCNHQKAINNSSLDNMLTKIDNRIKELKKKKQKYNDKDKIKKVESMIKSLKLKKDTKIKMKNVSLGTSRNNYIDPRIIFSFIKKYNIPSDKLFTKDSLKRFQWATTVDKDFKF